MEHMPILSHGLNQRSDCRLDVLPKRSFKMVEEMDWLGSDFSPVVPLESGFGRARDLMG